MKETILFVDDEALLLDSMKRQLRKRFSIDTALSGAEALEKFKTEGPYPVIISDMRMPKMDGVELLSRIKEMYPDTIRLMLTGNNDQETAMEAVNKGQIFRFLTKPCQNSVLIPSLALALRQYRLVTAERELLDKTLKGSIKVLSELLSFTNPTAFSAGLRILPQVMAIAEEFSFENLWQIEIATLLSHIGCITLPSEISNKVFTGIELSQEESQMFSQHPQAGADFLENIPRLDDVSFMIRHQLQPFPQQLDDRHSDYENSLSANIIKAVTAYDLLTAQGHSHKDALKHLQSQAEQFHPEILPKLKNIKTQSSQEKIVTLHIKDLQVGMIAEENILTNNEMLLVPKGQELTTTLLKGIYNFNKQVGVREPLQIRIRQQENQDEANNYEELQFLS